MVTYNYIINWLLDMHITYKYTITQNRPGVNRVEKKVYPAKPKNIYLMYKV